MVVPQRPVGRLQSAINIVPPYTRAPNAVLGWMRMSGSPPVAWEENLDKTWEFTCNYVLHFRALLLTSYSVLDPHVPSILKGNCPPFSSPRKWRPKHWHSFNISTTTKNWNTCCTAESCSSHLRPIQTVRGSMHVRNAYVRTISYRTTLWT